MQKFLPSLVMAALSVALTGCLQNEQQDEKVVINKNPYPSTYQVLPLQTTLIKNATVLTGTGTRMDNADVLMVDGKINKIGKNLSADGAVEIDANGLSIVFGHKTLVLKQHVLVVLRPCKFYQAQPIYSVVVGLLYTMYLAQRCKV